MARRSVYGNDRPARDVISRYQINAAGSKSLPQFNYCRGADIAVVYGHAAPELSG